MTTDVTADVINGLVAAGTLGLASATFIVARVTRQAAVDAASHRVVVTEFFVEPSLFPESSVTDKGRAMGPGTAWDLTRDGQKQIGLRAIGVLRNEGTSMARIRLEHDEQIRMDDLRRQPTAGEDPHFPMAFKITKQDGWYLVPTGGEATFIAEWWRPLSEWVASWQQGTKNPASPELPPTTTLKLLARGVVSNGPVDECTLKFGAYTFMPRPGQDGWAVADNSSKAAPPLKPPHEPIAQTGLIRRRYGRRERNA